MYKSYPASYSSESTSSWSVKTVAVYVHYVPILGLVMVLQMIYCLLEEEVRVPPMPRELRLLLDWQECVTNPDHKDFVNPRLRYSEMYDLALMGCQPEAIPHRPFFVW